MMVQFKARYIDHAFLLVRDGATVETSQRLVVALTPFRPLALCRLVRRWHRLSCNARYDLSMCRLNEGL